MSIIEKQKEQRRIPSAIVPTSDKVLGTYYDGFRSIPRSSAPWTKWMLGISMAFTLAIVAIMVGGNTSSPMIYSVTFGGTMVITSLLMMYSFSDKGSAKDPMKYYYVYSNGFVIEDRLKETGVVGSQRILFEDASSIDSYSVNIPSYESSSYTTRNDFRVYDHHDQLILEIQAYDISYVTRFAAQAIMQCWIKYQKERIMSSFYVNGYVDFEKIRMSRNSFVIDNVDQMAHADKVSVSYFFVTFAPADPATSPYYNSIKNPSGAWRIDIRSLKNKELFIEIFKEIYRDRFFLE